ncbi:hypothetical protein VTJ04DRAFT_6301 [Mycothermus thermophilus]|uniref:uncharacterized protein n=1 Tax=Humicola insolens TaxID=85995 RepID=UPI0037425405
MYGTMGQGYGVQAAISCLFGLIRGVGVGFASLLGVVDGRSLMRHSPLGLLGGSGLLAKSHGDTSPTSILTGVYSVGGQTGMKL